MSDREDIEVDILSQCAKECMRIAMSNSAKNEVGEDVVADDVIAVVRVNTILCVNVHGLPDA